MTKVFVANMPTKFDRQLNKHVPSVDVSEADQFGQLVVMTSSRYEADDIQTGVDTVAALADAVEPGDLILCVGDIALTAALIAYACDKNGTARILRYDRLRREYDILEVTL